VIENAIGGSGADRIIGNAVNNAISGRGGIDLLTGGLGTDTFQGTRTELNGDVITDFSRGDRIVIADAAVGGFSFSFAGGVLSYSGGSVTLSDLLHPSIAASAAPEGGVQILFSGPPIIVAGGQSVSSAELSISKQNGEALAADLLEQPIMTLAEPPPDGFADFDRSFLDHVANAFAPAWIAPDLFQ
jgi:hypothetical protein